MKYIDILGYTGGSMMALRSVADVYNEIKQTNNVSHTLQILTNLMGSSLFMTYGIIINNEPIYSTVAITIVNNMITLIIKMIKVVKENRQNRLY